MRCTFALGCLLLIGGGCGGDDTRVCFGSASFCGDAFGRNREPEADAGPDRRVVAGEEVELDGRDSFDPDGRIASYSWTQRSGDAVTLAGADSAIASFTAPDVVTETELEFRLIVTDDDDASDDDHVRVSIMPAPAAALDAGLLLLKTLYRPPELTVGRACRDCRAFLGLWLAARVQAARAGADEELVELLDELRMIEQLHAGLPTAGGEHAGPALRLFELGQQQVAGFTERRDPGIAALAARPASAAAGADVWRDALIAAYPHLGWFESSPGSRRYAVRLLLGPARALTAEAVAAATLRIALAEG